MDVDLTEHLNLHLPDYEFLWNCAISLKPVVSGVGLQFQWLEYCFFFYFDVTYVTDASIHFIHIVLLAFQQS